MDPCRELEGGFDCDTDMGSDHREEKENSDDELLHLTKGHVEMIRSQITLN